MKINRKDVAVGIFFIAVGTFYGIVAWKGLPIGRALNMGPGYFPIVLSCVLVALGSVVVIRGVAGAIAETPLGIVPWRAIFMLTLSVIVFAASFEKLGMLPSVFLCSMIASFSSPQVEIGKAILVSVGIACFCVVIFGFGVKLPAPVFGPWLVAK